MKKFKIIISILGIILVFGMVGYIQAQEKTEGAKAERWEPRLLWSKEYEWPLAHGGMHISDDGERVVIITQRHISGPRWQARVEMLDGSGTALWRKEINDKVIFSNLSKNGKYLLLCFMGGKKVSPVQQYYDVTGKKLWVKEVPSWVVLVSPDGEYLGFSGALQGMEPSLMDWWELRDKEFSLIWKYKPKWQFDAVVLSEGKTLIIEGNKLRLYDKRGRSLKEVLIPDIKPYRLSYQMGSVLPKLGVGPDRLASTEDGRYVAFVYSMEDEKSKDWLWTLYSVDMDTGRWWSYPLKTTQVDGVHITEDGRYVMVFRPMGLFFFDNKEGKLLWKDTTGWDMWDGSLLSGPEDISEDLGLIVIRWVVPGFTYKKGTYQVVPISDEEKRKIGEKSTYILGFHGNKVWKSETFLDEEQFSRHNKLLLAEKKGKVSLYEMVKR